METSLEIPRFVWLCIFAAIYFSLYALSCFQSFGNEVKESKFFSKAIWIEKGIHLWPLTLWCFRSSKTYVVYEDSILIPEFYVEYNYIQTVCFLYANNSDWVFDASHNLSIMSSRMICHQLWFVFECRKMKHTQGLRACWLHQHQLPPTSKLARV